MLNCILYINIYTLHLPLSVRLCCMNGKICIFKALFISNKHKVMEDYAVCSDVVFGMEARVGPIYDATDITMLLSQHFARH